MTAQQLTQYVSQLIYLWVFGAVLIEAVRRPIRSNLDMSLLFGATAIAIAVGWLVMLGFFPTSPLLSDVTAALIMTLPYLLLRVVADFTAVPRVALRGAEIGLAASVVALIVAPSPVPIWFTAVLVLYFLLVGVYAALAFWRESRSARGVTRRRLQWIAIGAASLAALILVAGLQAGFPTWRDPLTVLGSGLSAGSGFAFLLGFAPPNSFRQAWQSGEFRAFLARVASLPHVPDTAQVIRDLEEGTASAVGAQRAVVALWDAKDGWIVAPEHYAPQRTVPPEQSTLIGARSFVTQQAIFTPDAARTDQANADIYQQIGAQAILAAPITTGAKRFGVLVAYAPRAPIFAQDDLVLIHLLANQVAVVLETRSMFEAMARLRAREEADRLKDDFLSSAAHELKTPLTSVVALAQLLERRAERNADSDAEIEIVRRLRQEALRLNRAVLEMIDASMADHGTLIRSREPVDIVEMLREFCLAPGRHRCRVEAEASTVGEFDRERIVELIQHLVDNALAYSPDSTEVMLRVWREGEEIRLSIADQGIGIPPVDLPRIFERFQRGTNVDDRRYVGMGLGLYLSRLIVEQHGGRIWAESEPGHGTIVHVSLPAAVSVAS